MSRRIEIELTSARDGEAWTWRAAGARQPRGVVDSSLLPAGCQVGDVLRVEVDADIDGITILSVLPPREKSQPTDRIEVVGTPKDQPPVTTTLVGRLDRDGQPSRGPRDLLDPRGGGRSGGGRGGRPQSGDRGPRSGERSGGRPSDRDARRAGRPDGGAPGEGAEGADRTRTGGGRADRPGPRGSDRGGTRPGAGGRAGGRPERPVGFPGGERSPARDEERREGPGRAVPDRGPRQGGRPGPGGSARPGAGEHRAGGDERSADRRPARARPPRFVPGTVHRDAVLASLPEEQRPIADQLVAGGLPAVRRALAAEKERSEGPVDTSNHAAIVALAEQMLPAIKEAVWLDRAEAAIETLDHLSLRELRATVLGSAARDEHGRDLDRRLREALDQRVTRLRDSWHGDMTRALDDGRVLQALRLSGRPPEPSARFPAALVSRLAEAAGAAMTGDTPAERWTALLEAASASPVRRHVKPVGIPESADEEVLKLARQAAGRVPALAGLLGMAMPPPPGPPPPGHPPPGHTPPGPVPARPARPIRAASSAHDDPAGEPSSLESGSAETIHVGAVPEADEHATEPETTSPAAVAADVPTSSDQVAGSGGDAPTSSDQVAGSGDDAPPSSEQVAGSGDDAVRAEEVRETVNQR